MVQESERLIRQRKFAKHANGDVIIRQCGFSCRFIVSQADGFSSEHDSGAIFVVRLMPADAFETTKADSDYIEA